MSDVGAALPLVSDGANILQSDGAMILPQASDEVSLTQKLAVARYGSCHALVPGEKIMYFLK